MDPMTAFVVGALIVCPAIVIARSNWNPRGTFCPRYGTNLSPGSIPRGGSGRCRRGGLPAMGRWSPHPMGWYQADRGR